MEPREMLQLFQTHRDAEARRDYDAIIDTFTEDCYLETVPLRLRTVGRAATRSAYVAYFTAFPDLTPDDEDVAYGDQSLVTWGHLQGTSGGEWFGIPPTGKAFRVPFVNVTRFASGRMPGESLYFDLATLCEQADISLVEVLAAAHQRAAALPVQP